MQNDKFKLLQSGSLQHLGENMLSFLIHIAASSHIPKGDALNEEDNAGQNAATFFDILVTILQDLIGVLGFTFVCFLLFPSLQYVVSKTCCILRGHI